MKNLFFVFLLTISTGALACGGSDKAADADSTETTTETQSTEVSS